MTRILVLLFSVLASGLTLTAAESPVSASRFGISVDGIQIASFIRLDLLTSETKGLQDFTNDTTNRGVAVLSAPQGANAEMWAWHEAVILGDIGTSRRNVTIVAYNEKGDPVARYHLTDAWPAKIAIGALTSDSPRVMMETVTLVCDHIQRVAP
jgi:phage tail-like protein